MMHRLYGPNGAPMDVPTPARELEPDIIRAIEYWMHVAMREKAGHGIERMPNQYSYTFEDWLRVLYDLCPDAIARMLQAGADKYLAFEAQESGE